MAIKTANNQSMSAITALPSGVSAKSLILLATTTASSSATISFTSGIDSTYKEYIFKFIDVHPSAGDNHFTVNFRDGGSSYDATKTSTMFRAYHREDGTNQALSYVAGGDLAQATGVQQLGQSVDAANDSTISGELYLFSPSSTTFIKHFFGTGNEYQGSDYTTHCFYSGYCNVTAAIDGVTFKMNSGNIDSGVIKMYGITK